MPNTCEKCNQEFYSDTEYREHLFYHKLSDDNKRIGDAMDYIIATLRLGYIHSIAKEEGMTFLGAMHEWQKEWDMVNEEIKKQREARNAETTVHQRSLQPDAG